MEKIFYIFNDGGENWIFVDTLVTYLIKHHHFPDWFDDIACVDTEESRLHNTLLIFLQLKSNAECVPENVANCIELELSKSHTVHCEKVVFHKKEMCSRNTKKMVKLVDFHCEIIF